PLSLHSSPPNRALHSFPTRRSSDLNSNGVLNFTLVTNAFGAATITVTVNDGQPSNNIVTRSFTVTVNSINDLPLISDIADQTNNEQTSTRPHSSHRTNAETPVDALT